MLNDEKLRLLNAVRLPARLTDEDVATILGFSKHDIPILTKAGILKPLGNPAPNAIKYFAASEILALANDPQRLSKATQVVSRHWQNKNKKKNPESPVVTPGLN